MPKVKTIRVSFDGGKEDELAFSYDVSVTKDGIFSTTIPHEVVKRLVKAGVDVNRNRLGNPGYFAAESLQELEKQIEGVCQEFISRTLVSEKIVIRYIIQTNCHYLICNNGEFVPNGYWTEEKSNKWREGTRKATGMDRAPYGISIYTEVAMRRDYRYKSGTKKVEYDSVEEKELGGHRFSSGNNLKWLNDLVHQEEPEGEELQEIDYTEEVAAFFVSFYKAIFRVNEQIKEFLTPDAIKKLARQKFKLLGE